MLEVWSKVEEATPYCQKAISLCMSRLKWVNEDMKPTSLLDNNANIVNGTGKRGDQVSVKSNAKPNEEDEKEVLSGILSELERKVTTIPLQPVVKLPSDMPCLKAFLFFPLFFRCSKNKFSSW